MHKGEIGSGVVSGLDEKFAMVIRERWDFLLLYAGQVSIR
jgi:hypothetical protein